MTKKPVPLLAGGPPLVIALNPSVDVEWQVGEVRWEEKNSVLEERRWAGGKGVNVTRWLQLLEGRPRLVIPLGGETGGEIAAQLKRERIGYHPVVLREKTRANVIVTTREGRQLRFNPLGPVVSNREWKAICRAALQEMDKARCLVLSGSLPRGVGDSAYGVLITEARARKVPVLLDCDGPALAAAVAAQPDLVKPNEHELAQWAGRPLKTRKALVKAAYELADATSGWVMVSRGGEGALLVRSGQELVGAKPPRVAVQNTVGAGDALLAGVTWQMGQSDQPREWLRWGVALGTAATQVAAGQLPSLKQIRTLAAAVEMAQSAG